MIVELTQRLYAALQAEKDARAERMRLEAELAEAVGVPDTWEGTKTNDIASFKVTIKRSMNVKIDAEMLSEITALNNLQSVTSQTFRFKPEINKKAYMTLPEQVQRLYAPAITKTPGKVSFSVELKEDK